MFQQAGPAQSSPGGFLKGRLYLLKEGLVLLAVVSVLLLLSLGVVRLLQGKPEAGRGRPISAVELRLKDLIRAAIVEQDPILATGLLNNALDSILRRLLEAQGPVPYEVEVLILDSPVVNAVAFPGGLIVVYSGLIEKMERAEELAAVLAHELGHVVNRDSMKQLSRQMALSVFFSLLGGSQAKVLVQRILREVVNIHFSKNVEARADAFALKLLIQARIDPIHFAEALEHLSENREKPVYLKYLDGHPEIEARIKQIRERSKEVPIDILPLEIDWQAVQRTLPDLWR
ncbi:MAG TPA: M48 family metallopeptidase [Spirochaetales bacterium]|nr:M48 family metallopeptidase [Spirochaetales bacterium]